MIKFLIDGKWFEPDYFAVQAPAVISRDADYWESLKWLSLGLLYVKHPDRGTVGIVPKYHVWKFT